MSTNPDRTPLLDEQLSAWLDDELEAGELELLTARLMRSPEQQARLGRYSLIGSALRSGPSGLPTAQLVALHLRDRVRLALEQPGADVGLVAPSRPGRLLPYAMAAGVALVAVALLPLLRSADSLPEIAALARNSASGGVPAGLAVGPAPGSMAPESGNGGASLSRTRLTNYLVYHGEYSGMLSSKVADSHIVNQPNYVAAVQTIDQYPGP